MYCKYFVLKIYLRKKQLIIRVNIIVIETNNLNIANKIVIITKTK